MTAALPEIRRLLLLTGTAPAPNGVGGIILHDLAGFLPAGVLSVVHAVDTGQGGDTPSANGDPMRTLVVPLQPRPVSRWGRIGRALDWLRMTLANRRRVAAGVRACVEYARSHRIDEVWAVLDTPVSIALAAPVAAALGVPLRVTVWDDIEHNVDYFKLDRFTAKRSRRSFVQAVRRASRVAVIGETMQAEYARRYGQRGVIVRHGAECAEVELATTDAADSPIRIGFAGSVSARSAFKCLLDALDALGWHIDGRDVTLVLMGPRFDLWSQVPRRIECLGWQSVEDTIRVLSECTVNYLPQPFEPNWRPFAELSFPSKLTTYLAAGAPVLLHAPSYASLPAFFARHPFGASCTTLDAAALAEALQQLCLDDALRQTSREAAVRALHDEFSVRRFRDSFAEFIGINLHGASDAESTPCAASPAS